MSGDVRCNCCHDAGRVADIDGNNRPCSRCRKPPSSDGAMMTSFDRDILRHLNGEEVPGLSWGAAMGVAVEWLQGMGYATRGSNVRITDAGREVLTKSD